MQHVRVFVDDHLVAAPRQRAQAELVAHRPRGHKKGRFFAQHAGHDLLEPLDGGIFAVDVVTHRRRRHCAAHGLARPGDRIAPEIYGQAGGSHASPYPFSWFRNQAAAAQCALAGAIARPRSRQ